MRGIILRRIIILHMALVIFLLPETIQAERATQGEEVASAIRRYKQYEVSTGYYEEYEVLPQRAKPNVDTTYVKRQPWGLAYNDTASHVRNRSRLSDSHRGIRFYEGRRCESCHIEQSKDVHTVRANLTCRQCHGGEPIASINHYFSPMNPIRKHAYVCSKCHEGSSASFASYIIHEPPAGSIDAKMSFPSLYYSYWFMFFLLVGTLAFFISHSLVVGLSELLRKSGKGGTNEN